MGSWHSFPITQAGIVSNRKGTKFVNGRTVWICCIGESVSSLDLDLITLNINTYSARSNHGLLINVEAIVQLKVDFFAEIGEKTILNERGLLLASQHFLGHSNQQIGEKVKLTLESVQANTLSLFSLLEIYQKKEVLTAIHDSMNREMKILGLKLVSYSIIDINDDGGFLMIFGKPGISKVKKEAAQGKSRNESMLKISKSKIDAEILIAEDNRDPAEEIFAIQIGEQAWRRNLEFQLADNKRRVDRAEAKAKAAYELEKAKQVQKLKHLEAEQKLLESYEMLKFEEKECERIQIQFEGEAKAKLAALKNESDGKAVLAKSEAERIRKTGLAKVAVMRDKGMREAEITKKMAENCNHYNKNALLSQYIAKLPEISLAIQVPLSQVKNVSYVTNGSRQK